MDYPVIILRLSENDGGGYLGFAPDLLGCMGDGDTPEAALEDTKGAILEWLDAARQRNLAIPAPHSKAASERKEKEYLLKALREIGDSVENLDGRLDELARRIEEVEARLEHADAWSRFATITDGVALIETRQLTLYRDN